MILIACKIFHNTNTNTKNDKLEKMLSSLKKLIRKKSTKKTVRNQKKNHYN